MKLSEMTSDELKAALQDWRRWRNRVLSAETMRLRRERFAEAVLWIEAIERELTLRSPDVRHRLTREAAVEARAVAACDVVAFDAYRDARARVESILRRPIG